MDAFIYGAVRLCSVCGPLKRVEIEKAGQAPANPDDESTYGEDEYPKGPIADGGGVADFPWSCDECGEFLENPLTRTGQKMVERAFEDFLTDGKGDAAVIRQWATFYGITVSVNP